VSLGLQPSEKTRGRRGKRLLSSVPATGKRVRRRSGKRVGCGEGRGTAGLYRPPRVGPVRHLKRVAERPEQMQKCHRRHSRSGGQRKHRSCVRRRSNSEPPLVRVLVAIGRGVLPSPILRPTWIAPSALTLASPPVLLGREPLRARKGRCFPSTVKTACHRSYRFFRWILSPR
jgi:hypothetical protein